MSMAMGGIHTLNEADSKQYAFCAGGVDNFYRDRARIGGRCFAYCHVLGELTLRIAKVPTMSFLDAAARNHFRQQLCELGKSAVEGGGINTDELSRADSRIVVGLAVEDFSAKGRARDMQFHERQFVRPPDRIETLRTQQNFPHEYRQFLQGVRQRVLAGPKA